MHCVNVPELLNTKDCVKQHYKQMPNNAFRKLICYFTLLFFNFLFPIRAKKLSRFFALFSKRPMFDIVVLFGLMFRKAKK